MVQNVSLAREASWSRSQSNQAQKSHNSYFSRICNYNTTSSDVEPVITISGEAIQGEQSHTNPGLLQCSPSTKNWNQQSLQMVSTFWLLWARDTITSLLSGAQPASQEIHVLSWNLPVHSRRLKSFSHARHHWCLGQLLSYIPSFASYHRLARESDWEHGSCPVPDAAGPPGFLPGSKLWKLNKHLTTHLERPKNFTAAAAATD